MASAPWPGAGGASTRIDQRSAPGRRRPRRFRPAMASRMASASPACELGQPGVDIAAQRDDREVGPAVQSLGLAAQAGGAEPAPCGRSSRLLRERAQEGVARVLALGDGGDDQAVGSTRPACPSANGPRVDAAVQQRLLDLLGEQALAADLHQAAVLDAVAGGGDDAPATAASSPPSAAAMRRAASSGLGQGELGAAGADADRLRRSWRWRLPHARLGNAQTSDLATPSPSSASRPAATRPPRRWCACAGRPRVEVLSSIVASQIAAHAPYGGVVPEIAARAHVETIDAIVGRALARPASARPTSTASPRPPGRGWSAG